MNCIFPFSQMKGYLLSSIGVREIQGHLYIQIQGHPYI